MKDIVHFTKVVTALNEYYVTSSTLWENFDFKYEYVFDYTKPFIDLPESFEIDCVSTSVPFLTKEQFEKLTTVQPVVKKTVTCYDLENEQWRELHGIEKVS